MLETQRLILDIRRRPAPRTLRMRVVSFRQWFGDFYQRTPSASSFPFASCNRMIVSPASVLPIQ